jgi:Domain of unknown function (DUF6471)
MQKHPTSAAWRQTVERLLKAEMSKRAVKYQDLSERLAAVGITQTADNLRNKINKGILGADLLIQILLVLKVKQLERQTLLEILAEMGHRWED